MHCHSCFHVHAMATAIAIVLSVGPACRSAPTAATPVARPGQGSGGVSAAAAPQQTRLPEVDEMVARMARIGAAWSPAFSPDGTRVAFLSRLSGVPQVWMVDAQGGWPRLITPFGDPVQGVEWSPDGKWLAVAVAPGGGMNSQIHLIRPDGSEIKQITDGGKVNNWLGEWSYNGDRLLLSSSRRTPEAMDAYTYDLATGKMTLVAENRGIGITAGISRDGRRAVVWRMESRSNSNLFLVEAGVPSEVLLTPHQGPGRFFGGTFSPDGTTIYLGSDKDRDLVALARVTVDSAQKLSPLQVIAERADAELSTFAITDDGKTAALIWNVAGRSELSFLDLTTLESRPGPRLPGEIAGGLEFSRDGSKLAMTISGAVLPTDIWILEMASGTLRQLTQSPHAGIDLAAMVRPQLVRFKAHDGLSLSGWLYRPPGAAGPGPFVISFHGGPEGQARPSLRSDFQALLSRGIGIFHPNVRGSAGFGKRFVNLDNGALRFDAIKDIESCLDYLVEAGVADRARIGIMGGSYGGYMTMAGLTAYPDRFAAGANLFGVVNFATFFEHTEPWMAAISTIEYGDPDTQADLLRRLSPIHKLDQVTAPTIVLHGANDTNVPVIEAEQVVDTLRQRGVPVEYVLFPDEGHGFRKTPNRIRSTSAITEWFTRYLRPGR